MMWKSLERVLTKPDEINVTRNCISLLAPHKPFRNSWKIVSAWILTCAYYLWETFLSSQQFPVCADSVETNIAESVHIALWRVITHYWNKYISSTRSLCSTQTPSKPWMMDVFGSGGCSAPRRKTECALIAKDYAQHSLIVHSLL